MRLAITVLLCSFPLLCISQTKKNHFSYGIALAPSVEGYYNPADTINAYYHREKISYNLGIKTKYFVSDRLSINSGLIIYNKGTSYSVPLASIPGQAFNFTHLSTNIWYLTIPLNLQSHFPLPNQSVLSSNVGITYGRKVLQYFHQTDPKNNFYYFSQDGSSDIHLGVVFGLSYTTNIKEVIIEINPCYIRQVNSGWKYAPDSTPNIRYDSYLLEFTFYGLTKKGH